MSRKKYIVFCIRVLFLFILFAFQKPVYATEADIEVEIEEDQEVRKEITSQMSTKVYYEMDEDSAVLANVLQGSEVTILMTESDEMGDVWYLICTDTGVEGYIREGALAQEAVNEQMQLVVRQIDFAQNVNIREYASTDSAIVGRVPVHTVLTPLLEEFNEEGELWYRIEYEGTVGYIRESTVDVVENTEIAENAEEVEQQDGQDSDEISGEIEENSQANHDNTLAESEVEQITYVETENSENKVESNKVVTETEAEEQEEKLTVTTRGPVNPIDYVVIAMAIGVLVSLLFAIVALIIINGERKSLSGKQSGKKGKSKYKVGRKG